jgi:hypothetical protein
MESWVINTQLKGVKARPLKILTQKIALQHQILVDSNLSFSYHYHMQDHIHVIRIVLVYINASMSFSSVPHKDTLFNVINRTADIAVPNETKKIAETAWSEPEVSIEKINSLEERGKYTFTGRVIKEVSLYSTLQNFIA